jgi:hypothetical protein
MEPWQFERESIRRYTAESVLKANAIIQGVRRTIDLSYGAGAASRKAIVDSQVARRRAERVLCRGMWQVAPNGSQRVDGVEGGRRV